MRICLIYDCLYPHTVGGAERWYRNLALRLDAEGHEVTYLTMRQWGASEQPDLPGVRVVPVTRQMPLYARGRRRILPTLLFGMGVLRHLMRHGRRYDAVHTASFPYFSLLAAGLVRPLVRYRIVVDWHELWTRAYWREYLGTAGGSFGRRIQRLCLAVPQRAFCFSRLVEQRLLAEGIRGKVTVLEGQFDGTASAAPLPAELLVVFAGRHIPEKGPVAVVRAVAKARESIPELRGTIFGDGPERRNVLAAIAELGLSDVVEAPGFVDASVVEDTIARALCLVLPSRREGYGLVVLEALSKGTPAIVVEGEDNAATEFIAEGENGFVVADASADELAAAVVESRDRGERLRKSTLYWFVRNAGRLSLETSLETVTSAYSN